jgi:hypothetical protein
MLLIVIVALLDGIEGSTQQVLTIGNIGLCCACAFSIALGENQVNAREIETCRHTHIRLEFQVEHLKLSAESKFGAERDNTGNAETREATLEQLNAASVE